MKILQVAYKSDISGGEKVLFDLATSLKNRGHEVIVVCPDPGQLPDELKKTGIHTNIIPFHKTYDLRAARRLSNFVRRENIEILHSHSMLTNIISRLAGHWAKVPVSVSTEHLTMELARGGRGTGILEKLKGRYYRFLGNFTSRYNQAVIAVSEAVKHDLLKQGVPAQKIVVIRNGVRITGCDPVAARRVREELGVGDDVPVIGTVGRLSPQKDYPTFLKAAREVLKVFAEAIFLIAGEGPLRSDLENMCTDLGIEDRVKFLGYRSDILSIISCSDVFVLSSLWEGLPLAVLEAMSMERPVVATSVAGTVEAVVEGETGLSVPLKNYRAFARAIVGLLKNPEKARRMGRAGRMRVEKRFSLKRMVDEHESLYRDLAEKVGLRWH